MKKMKDIVAVVILAVVGAAFGADTCKEHDHDHEHEHEHGHGHGHELAHAQGAEVRVSAAAARAMGLKTVRAERRRMLSTVSLWGRVELTPDARMSVASSVGGRVQLKVRPLQAVRAGDVLFTVDAPEVLAKTKEIELLERRLKVYRELNRASADLEAQLALRKAECEALLAGAEETNGVVTVRATEAGRVDALSVLDGAWVSSGAAVVELVRTERVRVKALVPASEAARLKDGLKVRCGDAVGVLQLGLGDSDGLMPVYAVFDKERLSARSGERLLVECVTDASETPVVAVPAACVVRVGLEPTVFVRDEHAGERFAAVKVTLGRTNGGWTEVVGLPDDDDLEIVKEGAYELKIALSTQAGVPAAGHFHADGTFHEGED